MGQHAHAGLDLEDARLVRAMSAQEAAAPWPVVSGKRL
jgi:hypothetical protein